MAVGPTRPAAPKRVPVPASAPVSKPRPKRQAARKAGVGVQSAASGGVGAGPVAGVPSRLPAGPAGADPRFRQTLDRLDRSATRSRQHPPASKKAAEAEAASQLPTVTQQQAGAREHQVEAMQAAPVGKKPQESSFLDELRKAIKATMPGTVEEGDSYMKGSDRQNLTNAISGNIQQQKGQAAGPLEAEAKAPLKPDQVQTEPTAAVPPAPTPPAPQPVGAAQAMPLARPVAEVSLEPAKRDTNRLLTDNELTPDQLKNANDPRFSAVLTTKAEADKYADAGPSEYRGREQAILATAATQASTEEKQALGAFRGSQVRAGNTVFARQLTAREKDEAERKAVIDHIQSIYARTKKAVDETLDGMERDGTRLFDQGANDAIERMKKYVEDKFDDRYGGWTGWAKWLKDKILPLPDFVKEWFSEAHTQFEADLDKLVVQVANLVEQRLALAKLLITQGETEIRVYVSGLKPSLQTVGKSAEKDMQDRFGDLRRTVDDRKQAMAQKLAQQYKDARDKGDSALKELRDKHKSLYERVRDFVEEVVEVLRNFKRRILSLLKKAAEVIGTIVAHPIRFLGNLIGAIKQGLGQFKDHIWDHLKEALFMWMFGSLAEAGITVPKDFSLGGILKLLLAVLGLTYERIRGKLVRLIGERNVALIEKVWSVVHTLLTGGPAALWEQIKEYISGLPDMLIGVIKNWVITEIIKAAIVKLAMLFNPVGAIVQAIITIYNTVMFFIERYKQILDFVEAVFNSIAEIARGNIGAAANAIEKALVGMLVLLISFLARFAGITGITSKIKDFVEQVRERVDKAIDFLIEKVVRRLAALRDAGRSVPSGVGREGSAAPARGAPAAGEGPATTGVKIQVLAEVRARTLGRRLESFEALHAILQDIYSRHRPEGLKSLSAEVVDPNSMGVGIEAIASPAVQVVLPWEEVFTAHDPDDELIMDLQLAYAVQGWETTASVVVQGQLVAAVNNSSAGHAEQVLLASPAWQAALERARDLARPRPNRPATPVTLAVLINRAPCHSFCTGELIRKLGEARAAAPGVHFVLAATGTYEATNQMARNEIVRQIAEELVKRRKIPLKRAKEIARRNARVPEPAFAAHATRYRDLERLVDAGWDLRQLLARERATVSGEILGQAIRRIKTAAAQQFNQEERVR